MSEPTALVGEPGEHVQSDDLSDGAADEDQSELADTAPREGDDGAVT